MGVFTRCDGMKFQGEFKDGKINGLGNKLVFQFYNFYHMFNEGSSFSMFKGQTSRSLMTTDNMGPSFRSMQHQKYVSS